MLVLIGGIAWLSAPSLAHSAPGGVALIETTVPLEDTSDAGIAAAVNGSFVPARIVDRSREDGTNVAWIAELQQRYSVSAFPTLIVADSSGRELARMEGYSSREKLARFLAEAKNKAGN